MKSTQAYISSSPCIRTLYFTFVNKLSAMATPRLFLVLLALTSLFLICNAKPRKPPPRQTPPPPLRSPPPPARPAFTQYTLALQWPVSVLKTDETLLKTDIKKLPLKFTIHGLWPQDAAPTTGEDLEVEQIKSIKTELETSWINVAYSKSDAWKEYHRVFWAEQWAKHGRESGLGQLEYFKLALHLYSKVTDFYDLNNIGKKYPPGTKISANQLKNEFRSFGVPIPKCKTSLGRNGVPVLTELYFNVTSESLVFLKNYKSKCDVDSNLLPNNDN